MFKLISRFEDFSLGVLHDFLVFPILAFYASICAYLRFEVCGSLVFLKLAREVFLTSVSTVAAIIVPVIICDMIMKRSG